MPSAVVYVKFAPRRRTSSAFATSIVAGEVKQSASLSANVLAAIIVPLLNSDVERDMGCVDGSQTARDNSAVPESCLRYVRSAIRERCARLLHGFGVGGHPLPDPTDCFAQIPAHCCDGVVHVWRNDRMHTARHEPVALQLAQRLGQHLLADAADQFAKACEPNRITGLERIDHKERPFIGHAVEKLSDEPLGPVAINDVSHSIHQDSIALRSALLPTDTVDLLFAL